MNVTLTIETYDPALKAKQRLIESVVRVALDNYAAMTANDDDYTERNRIIEMIRENIDIKVVWK